jgi:hypothetical protein
MRFFPMQIIAKIFQNRNIGGQPDYPAFPRITAISQH